MRRQLESAIGNRRSAMRRGFTLVEMLTVIGIIILLVSILLPVVGSVRQKAHAADTGALLNNIAAGIQRYHADFNAYPGPIHNGHIYGGTMSPALSIGVAAGTPSTGLPNKITQSENLVLGLLGGLVRQSSGSASGGLVYDRNLVGNGPLGLNPLSPKKYQAYMDKTNLSEGDYKDDVADADDSVIPEFLDRFPDGMPILYLRANAGAGASGGTTSESPPIVSPTHSTASQYSLNQILGYTSRDIGVGKDLPAQTEYVGPGVSYATNKHGLRTANRAAAMTTPVPPGGQFGGVYVYPYDLYAYLRHPSIPNTARNKDGFILISAGIDRVYGTKDDIQQPPTR